MGADWRHGLREAAAAFSVLLAAPLPGAAQSAGPVPVEDQAPADTVVVTGMRLKPEKLDSIIGDFVQSHGKHAPRTTQIARWDRPVCPGVQNVPADFAAFIATRIRAIAQTVGAPLADTPCKTNNVDIIFTDQPQAVMDTVADKYPRLLGYHFVHQTKAVSQMTRPIQAWYVTSTSNGAMTAIDDPYGMTIGGGLGSRLSTGDLRPVLTHILIMVNTDQILGRQLGTVADYLAVLALAQPNGLDHCGDLPSILDQFSGTCPDDQKPRNLSAADKAYLEGLYSMDPREVGTLQRSSIAGHMRHSFGAP
ncbi:hypothetical protein [Azospirillum sp. B4]|uniref:hypothetical protein n=1 Tax=Azospirillum sp. B4 TaxID=95605 RepID=UPI00034783CA|nr:hypothetical protein [Azospirillum sp. B4]